MGDRPLVVPSTKREKKRLRQSRGEGDEGSRRRWLERDNRELSEGIWERKTENEKEMGGVEPLIKASTYFFFNRKISIIPLF